MAFAVLMTRDFALPLQTTERSTIRFLTVRTEAAYPASAFFEIITLPAE